MFLALVVHINIIIFKFYCSTNFNVGSHMQKHNRCTWIDMYLLYCRCLSCINPDDGLINLSETCRQDFCTKYILRLTENLDSFPRDWAVRYGVYCIKLSLLSTIWRTTSLPENLDSDSTKKSHDRGPFLAN